MLKKEAVKKGEATSISTAKRRKEISHHPTTYHAPPAVGTRRGKRENPVGNELSPLSRRTSAGATITPHLHPSTPIAHFTVFPVSPSCLSSVRVRDAIHEQYAAGLFVLYEKHERTVGYEGWL
ncbi:hypothetical protein AKJ64_04725, partial [candidate division MSBL1 archaeon SCGC-AAA259E17]